MLEIKELAKTVELAYYTSIAIKNCAKEYEEIDEFMSVKYVIDMLVEKLDKIYSKIINENILYKF